MSISPTDPSTLRRAVHAALTDYSEATTDQERLVALQRAADHQQQLATLTGPSPRPVFICYFCRRMVQDPCLLSSDAAICHEHVAHRAP